MSDDEGMSFAEKVGRFVLFPISRKEESVRRKRELAEQQQREAQAEAERLVREKREEERRQELIATEEKKQARELALKEKKRDRESILFEIRLLYDRHSAEIRDSLSVERFEQYFEDFFPENLAIETLAERAKKLEEMILSFFVDEESSEKTTTLADIDAEYERRKQDIESSTQDHDTKDSLIARLEKWRAKAMRELTTY